MSMVENGATGLMPPEVEAQRLIMKNSFSDLILGFFIEFLRCGGDEYFSLFKELNQLQRLDFGG